VITAWVIRQGLAKYSTVYSSSLPLDNIGWNSVESGMTLKIMPRNPEFDALSWPVDGILTPEIAQQSIIHHSLPLSALISSDFTRIRRCQLTAIGDFEFSFVKLH
jgi:hypothetical protein